MKQIGQSIINSTKSLPGRWTKVTTVGCILALVFLGTTSAQPKASGTARPFKATGIVAETITNPDGVSGAFVVVGTATHLGKFVSNVDYQVTAATPDLSVLFVHVWGKFTAANGDTIQIDIPEWVVDHTVTPPTSTGLANIIGGTGRFANASGSYVANISPADAAPGVTQIWTAEGTISY